MRDSKLQSKRSGLAGTRTLTANGMTIQSQTTGWTNKTPKTWSKVTEFAWVFIGISLASGSRVVQKKENPACTSLRKAHLCGRHIFAEGTSLRDAQFVSVWCGCNRHTHEITRWVEFRKVVHKRKDIDVYKDSVHTFIYTSYFLCCGHKQTLTRELRLRTHLIHYFSRTSTTTKRQRFVNTSGYNQKCKYKWTKAWENAHNLFTHICPLSFAMKQSF